MQTHVLPVSWRAERSDRLKSAFVVLAVHGLLAYLFLAGMVQHEDEASPGEITVFDVPLPPPVQEREASARKSRRQSGRAAPAGPAAPAAPVPAPVPKIAIPHIQAAPPVSNSDNQAAAGTSATPGYGPGSGGAGDGSGSGSGGSGTGSGIGRHAAREEGALRDSDYPRAAAAVRASGTVFIRFTVEADGRVSGCSVTQSSGNADLDRTTCKLVERRFRYRPALDEAGRPMKEEATTNFTWGVRG